MSITLDATLKAAQDGIDRWPLVRIKSQRFSDVLPFLGNDFGVSEAGDEPFFPAFLYHSSGRLCMWYWTDYESARHYWVTDTDRQQWSEYYKIVAGFESDMSMVELPSGNIGRTAVVYRVADPDYGTQAEHTLLADTITFGTPPPNISDTIDSMCPAVNASDKPFIFYTTWDGVTAYIGYTTSTSDWSGLTNMAYEITPALNTTRPIIDIHVLTLNNGDMLMSFAYATAQLGSAYVYNIYTMTSTTGGLTWGNVTKITDYDVVSEVGVHPYAAQESDDTITLVYNEQLYWKRFTDASEGFSTNCPGIIWEQCRGVHYNHLNNRIYSIWGNDGMGTKGICAVMVINPDTWAVDHLYDSGSSPALNEVFAQNHSMHSDWGCTGYHVVFDVRSHIAFIDDLSLSVRAYHFEDDATYGVTANINDNPKDSYSSELTCSWYDANSGKIWCLFTSSGSFTNLTWIGYMNINELADAEGNYDFHTLGRYGSSYTSRNMQILNLSHQSMLYIPEEDWLLVAYNQPLKTFTGELLIIHVGSGAIFKGYNYADYSDFPKYGVRDCVYLNGFIYATFTYDSSVPEKDKKGVLRIDPASDTFTYLTPSWSTGSHWEYRRARVEEDDDTIWFASADGVGMYDTTVDQWTLYDVMGGCDSVDYDAVSGMIFTGHSTDMDAVTMSHKSGLLRQTQYAEGTGAAGVYTFGAFNPLISGYTNYEAVIAIDEDDLLWAVWTHYDALNDRSHLYWDNLLVDYNLINDLTIDPISVEWDIEATSILTFTLAHGYLFDPQNSASTYSVYVEKGRKLFLEFGENINGVPYWQNQGMFIVTGSQLTYKRGTPPTIVITAEDPRVTWEDHRMIVSDYFSEATPKAIINELLAENTYMVPTEYDVPDYDDSHEITTQFVDTLLIDAINQINEHFFYAIYYNVNGKFTTKKIDLTKVADHTYSDSTQTISHSPDDTYSNLINRVTVTGETDSTIIVTYNEELIAQKNGTVGWWGGNKDIYVYYSADLSRQCRRPRLDATMSLREFKFFVIGGGGGEYISYEDPNELYCIITLDKPDMTFVFAGILLNLVASMVLVAIFCSFSAGFIVNYNPCGLVLAVFNVWLSLLLGLLAMVANYAYDIYARPVGHEKQSVSATANDLEMQARLGGQVVAEVIDDSLCGNAAECERVAEGELAILKAQRNRVMIQKVAHLQDEVLDMLSLIHPSSETAMKVLVTKLRRELTRASIEEGGSGEAGIFDYIEGWKLT